MGSRDRSGYVPIGPSEFDPGQWTQSSPVTILTIWNTMIGTSVVALPWAFNQSGLAMGVFIILLINAIAMFTALTILKLHSKHSVESEVPEFAQLCGLILGPKWEYVCAGFSLAAVLGVAIVYWILMSNFLYNTIEFGQGLFNEQSGLETSNGSIAEILCSKSANLSTPNSTTTIEETDTSVETEETFFTAQTTPLILIILMPLICLKSPTFFTKFNSLGTINIVFLIGVVFYFASQWGINATLDDIHSEHYIPMFKNSFPSLSGMMALGFFIHNAILTILKKNRYQENNQRDVAAGFCLVSATYMLIGITFYLSFPLAKDCIEDNFLNNFPVDTPLMIAARLMLLFQLITVFPLIMYILRSQFFMLVLKTENVGYKKIFLLNSIVVAISILFAIFMPTIGNIIRYVGGLCGAVVVFILPSMAHLKSAKQDGKLKWFTLALYCPIIYFGVANFFAQFSV